MRVLPPFPRMVSEAPPPTGVIVNLSSALGWLQSPLFSYYSFGHILIELYAQIYQGVDGIFACTTSPALFGAALFQAKETLQLYTSHVRPWSPPSSGRLKRQLSLKTTPSPCPWQFGPDRECSTFPLVRSSSQHFPFCLKPRRVRPERILQLPLSADGFPPKQIP